MRSARSGPGGRALTRLVTALLHAGAASVAAQAPARPDTTVPAGTVVGSVVAAQTGGPLEDALVLLEPAPAGARRPGVRPASLHGQRDLARHERRQERGGEHYRAVGRSGSAIECGMRNAECQWRVEPRHDAPWTFRIPHSALS